VLSHKPDSSREGGIRFPGGHTQSPDPDIACIRLYETTKDVHQGGFSRTILPNDGVNLPFGYFKIDPVIRQYPPE
jgi:hypothetical protein